MNNKLRTQTYITCDPVLHVTL